MLTWAERFDMFEELGVETYIYESTCKRAGYSHDEMCRYEDEQRLAHRAHDAKPCTKLGPADTFDCYYIFGETILHTTHGFGECPYLKGTAR